ncbi:MAG: serine/threonine protein kinase [Planctomycetales bacterium]|nr:serine/threonine protein kinase [Planctomycetales bacterium]
MRDLTGQQLNDFLVLRRLGQGAMAEVYLAEQKSLDRQVALKVLKEDLSGDAAYVDRFLREARSAAALVHANIVQVYEVGLAEGQRYIAQEYVPGKNLAEVLRSERRLEPGLVLDILRQAAAALHKAYEGGVVHRDIKPENLMLARSGELKVADFGLARALTAVDSQLTQIGVTMGTPLYMSPEQIEGRGVDVRSDLYSLGVTAYHLLLGEPPFTAETPLGVAVKHLNNQAAPLADALPELPLRLSQVVERLMAKKPEDRFQTPGELLAELRQLAKAAAAEGWAEGPENWATQDLAALRDEPNATAELSQLMKELSRLQARRRAWVARALAAIVGLVLGGLLAVGARPAGLLDGASRSVPKKQDVLSQIFHAKQADTRDAWLAVYDYFAPLDPSLELLADQGLVRFYLRQQRYSAARQLCWDIYDKAGDQQPEARQFALAGITIACVGMEEYDEAEEAFSAFDFTRLAELQQLEPLVGSMFSEATERLDGSSQAGSSHGGPPGS